MRIIPAKVFTFRNNEIYRRDVENHNPDLLPPPLSRSASTVSDAVPIIPKATG